MVVIEWNKGKRIISSRVVIFKENPLLPKVSVSLPNEESEQTHKVKMKVYPAEITMRIF